MLFSIIVPVYKVEDCLCECVDSILGQNYSDFEVILVDDGSPDKCPEICDRYASADRRVKAIHKQNGGLSDARNVGIRAARGEYLIFVDSDDALTADALENIADCTIGNPDVIITELYNTTDMRLDRIHPEKLFSSPEKKDKSSVISFVFEQKEHTWASVQYIVKKRMVEKNALSFEVGYYHEDMAWTPRLFAYIQNVAFYNKIWYVRRMDREGSITYSASYKKINDALTLLVNEIHSNVYSKMNSKNKTIIYRRLVGSIFSTLNRCACCTDEERNQIADYMKTHFDVFQYTRKLKHKVIVVFARLFGMRSALKLLTLIG